MFKSKLTKLLKDEYLTRDLPKEITVPALGAIPETSIKNLEDATLDDLAFAAQALDLEVDAINSRLYAIRRLYRAARSKGALGAENIVDALSRKGGDQ
ncbi:hypothetical protein [Kiloniella sp.]|uniref:hypothetical protein n=1 Tax=Kiloniella sp. TaxID=1938587 RepID=UPI003B013944